MEYSADLKIPSSDSEKLIKSISVDDLNTNRAKVKFSKDKNIIIIRITSGDIVMLRATMNTVLRHISVSEKLLLG
ncbi:MAG: hypothetical protein KAJ54_00095 [Candidatus Aenigmarchaeota archaeon]|nr:hypothetical protein [Candidatus Aenigmarchaeota archaeon]MCK5321865.1 hypothetical protein [Candidatus Aenigmarchaeota archaeon]